MVRSTRLELVMPNGATPSRWYVYQFHHDRKKEETKALTTREPLEFKLFFKEMDLRKEQLKQ